jgi:AraC family transcriptional regulator
MDTNEQPTTTEHYHQRMLTVLQYIQENLNAPLELDSLARIACFSPFHFHRIFKAMVGEGVYEHVRRLRLERAATQLILTSSGILPIALEAGFESHEAFSRAFKAMFKQSPAAFRAQRRGEVVASGRSKVHYGATLSAESLSSILPKKGKLPMEVKIVDCKPIQVAFVRHVGPYANVHKAWSTVCSWAGKRGLLGPETQALGVSYDDPTITPPEKLRYEACITLAQAVEAEGEIGVRTIPGGLYAVCRHKGSYAKLSQTFAMFYGQWLPSSGYTCRNLPPYELYVNDPEKTPEAELLTDIYVPVEKS